MSEPCGEGSWEGLGGWKEGGNPRGIPQESTQCEDDDWPGDLAQCQGWETTKTIQSPSNSKSHGVFAEFLALFYECEGLNLLIG